MIPQTDLRAKSLLAREAMIWKAIKMASVSLRNLCSTLIIIFDLTESTTRSWTHELLSWQQNRPTSLCPESKPKLARQDFKTSVFLPQQGILGCGSCMQGDFAGQDEDDYQSGSILGMSRFPQLKMNSD